MSTDMSMSLEDFSFPSPQTPPSDDIISVAPWREFEHQMPQKRSIAKMLNLQGGSSSDISRTRYSEDSTESHRKNGLLTQIKRTLSRPNLKKQSQDQQFSQPPLFQPSDIDFSSSSIYLSPSSVPRASSPLPHKKSMKFVKKKPQPLAATPPLPLPKDCEQRSEISMDRIRDVPLHDIVKDYVPGDRRHEMSNESNPSFEPTVDEFQPQIQLQLQQPQPSFIDPFRKTSQITLYDRVPGSSTHLSEPFRKLGSSGSTTFDDDSASWAAPQSWAVEEGDLENVSPDHPSSDEECDHDLTPDSNEPPARGVLTPCAMSNPRDPPIPERRKPSSHLANEILVPRKDSDTRDRQAAPYLIRVDRDDLAQYHVVECFLHTTVHDLQKVLRRKIFQNRDAEKSRHDLNDSKSRNNSTVVTVSDSNSGGMDTAIAIEPHRLYLRERGRERLLAPTEKPAVIVRRRLEQAGYTLADGFEKLGTTELPFLLKFVYRSEQLGKPLVHERYTLPEIPREPEPIKLDLSGKSLRAIPAVCYQYVTRIENFDLSKNPLLEIPFDFAEQCVNLRSLLLKHMTMKKVPQSVRHIQSLEALDLSCNRLVDLDEAGLGELPKLVELRMPNNRIDHLPVLSNVRILNISNNKFEIFPETVCQMHNLEQLDISFNTICKLPPGLGELTELRRLNIAGNQVSEFPPQSSNLVNLVELDCRRNNITDLLVICKLPRLQTLRADHNAVSALDLSLGPSFKTLEVTNNDITRLTLIPGPTQTRTFSLTHLDISHAKLSSLNDFALTALTSLISLKLDYNSFRYLPDAICSLTDLHVLSCTDNELDSLPTNIGQLKKLRVLDMHNNNLTEVPPGIWECGALERINMTSNLIKVWHDLPPPADSLKDDLRRDRKMSGTTTVAASLQAFQLPLARSLKELYLGDNRLDDDVFHPLNHLKELIVLNLSFNDIQEIPPFWLQSLSRLQKLYLSGNKLTSLPSENLVHLKRLTELFLNGNKLQTLPTELGRLVNLAVIDVGSNMLKYNINNYEFDWNWNFNPQLRYLNLSGNERLVIKPDQSRRGTPVEYTYLKDLRILGLIGVKIDETPFHDETTDIRRVRLTSPRVNGMSFGIADMLGKQKHLGMFDLVHSEFRSRKDECLFGMFGVLKSPTISSSHSHFTCEQFAGMFKEALRELKTDGSEGVSDALRRTFLRLNMRLYDYLVRPRDSRKLSSASNISGSITEQTQQYSLKHGAEGIVMYLVGKKMFVANVGKALAVISRQGIAHHLSMNHDPFDRRETARIRAAEGWVSPKGLVNDEIEVSRAFGYYHVLPAVNSRPQINEWILSERDEFVIIANRGLWDYITYQTAVDIARNHKDDPMIAAQKLRDFAMSYGADGSTMIMVICVADLFRPEQAVSDSDYAITKRGMGRKKDDIVDKKITRLVPEIEPPRGHIALVFTDIKNSTLLWDKNSGMATAIKLHHHLLRRLLRQTLGYEVKTEGDAFMVSFSDVLHAVQWCFTVQVQLLHEQWPKEILESEDGKELYDSETRLIARGLSVRMGIHCGVPYCERDPVTRRMDYFGPMVNRTARIMGSADGGQIFCSRDVIKEINDRVFSPDPDRSADVDTTDFAGMIIKEVGEKRMKGLEEPELISLILPKELEGRLELAGIQNIPKPPEISTPDDQQEISLPESSSLPCSLPSSQDDSLTGETLSSDHTERSTEFPEPESPVDSLNHTSSYSLLSPPYTKLEQSFSLPPLSPLPFNLEQFARDIPFFKGTQSPAAHAFSDIDIAELSLEDQVKRIAHLCLRIETLSSSRVFRAVSHGALGLNPDLTDDPLILYADPDLLIPSTKGRSTSELYLLLDSLSSRSQRSNFAMDVLSQTNGDSTVLEELVSITEEPILIESPTSNVAHGIVDATEPEVKLVISPGENTQGSFANVTSRVKERTCYVYEPRMLNHWPTINDEGESPHPEQPARISEIHHRLRLELCLERMTKIPTRPLEKFEALLVHSEDHWDKVEAIALMDDEAIRASEEYYEHLSLYVHRNTPEVAKLSAGGVTECCLAVARGEYQNAFAIVRPPGHHAEPEEHMGFCFFNNVAIAARVVQQKTNIKRILILDWDVHHGNGTQRAFWTDDTVLYISLHRYEMGTFYPCGSFGSLDSCGEGKGLGTSVNIPWPTCGMGDADYLYAFEKIVLPISYEFAPELVIISAGFDAADGDTLGECNVTPAGFAHMTHMLCSLAGGKVVVALEACFSFYQAIISPLTSNIHQGGYNLEVSANSAAAVTRVLLGDAPPELPPMVASEEATETVWQVATQQSKYWKCMDPKAVEPREDSQGHTLSIPELLKMYRSNHLFSKYEMYQIPFVDEALEARFGGQIVCTKNVYTCTQTLIVLAHDLCDLRVELDGKMYCNVQEERSYLEDTTNLLIDWINGTEDFAYIDLHLNSRLVPEPRIRSIQDKISVVSDVITYIWDNYIELSEAKHVILICHGIGCRGTMQLLKNRDITNKVRGIIHITPNGLPPRAPQDDMQSWYRKNSLVFISPDSRIFEDGERVQKRYGNVHKLPYNTSSRLFVSAMPQIKEFVAEQVLNAHTVDINGVTTGANGLP